MSIRVTALTSGQASPGSLALEGRPYRWHGIPGWEPGAAIRGTGPVRPLSPGHPNSPESKAARLAAFTEWREKRLCLAEAARLTGIAPKTARRYEAERLAARKRAAS